MKTIIGIVTNNKKKDREYQKFHEEIQAMMDDRIKAFEKERSIKAPPPKDHPIFKPIYERLVAMERMATTVEYLQKRLDGDHARSEKLETITFDMQTNIQSLTDILQNHIKSSANLWPMVHTLRGDVNKLMQWTELNRHKKYRENGIGQPGPSGPSVDFSVRDLKAYPLTQDECFKDPTGKHDIRSINLDLKRYKLIEKDGERFYLVPMEEVEQAHAFDVERLKNRIREIKEEVGNDPVRLLQSQMDGVLFRLKNLEVCFESMEKRIEDVYSDEQAKLRASALKRLMGNLESRVERLELQSSEPGIIYNESKSKLPYKDLCDMVLGMQNIVNELQSRTSDQIVYGTISQVKHTPAYVQDESCHIPKPGPLVLNKGRVVLICRGSNLKDSKGILYQVTEDQGGAVLQTVNSVKDGIDTLRIFDHGTTHEKID